MIPQDWNVGDLALCVDARTNPAYGPSPLREGAAYRVIRVYAGNLTPHNLYGYSDCGLELLEIASSAPEGWAAVRFRKIRPDEHEACEEEFRILLKLSKRRVKA